MFAAVESGHDDVVTEGLALAGSWLIYLAMLSLLGWVLLRRQR